MVGNDEGEKGRDGIRKMVERKVVGGEGMESNEEDTEGSFQTTRKTDIL